MNAPLTNEQISADDVDNLRHMLGATRDSYKRDWGYRNHFCANKSGPDYESMIRLEAAGMVTRGRAQTSSIFFHCTEAGCKAAGLNEKQTRRALYDR